MMIRLRLLFEGAFIKELQSPVVPKAEERIVITDASLVNSASFAVEYIDHVFNPQSTLSHVDCHVKHVKP